MTRKMFDFMMEPEGKILESLLLWAAGIARTCGFVVRSKFPTSTKAVRLAAELRPCLEISREVSYWPGTELRGKQRAISYEYAYSMSVAHSLLDAEQKLYSWIAPEMPEDLYLLRDNGELLLGSIAHEREAWLALDDNELVGLERSVPGIKEILTERGP
jgi:hypothetical protein